MAIFSKSLSGMLKANHRQQEDFRLDDVAARVKKQRSQGDVYNIDLHALGRAVAASAAAWST